ncbi:MULTISPECIES: magnesium transporter CorA family protein [unclassified Rhizobium]|uniref:magnesium transporter CorA family protein n=1 Tax=unclassified Rhizobium TaxID=2613769 RepID=UPI0007149267|nr:MULTISPECIES: magnesium transporter CorA family protein [unclassified Rhizobium]KQS96215.1 magnesium transporter [Rhizobium sp. Leaf386]KQT06053.1 magnesium transporter [Rhizobium sp. Leaf391]KQU09710.1 magnesium transporter [Rhizobium sp. Leaf453]
MITAYRANGEAVVISADKPPASMPAEIVWLDLLRPDKAEDLLVESLLGIEVPTREDMKDIEPSSRLYTAKDAVFMTASLVCKVDSGQPELTDVAFVLTKGLLITIRYEEPKAFDLFVAAMHRIPGGCATGTILVTRLFETIVDRTAEILEIAVTKIDALSLQVFGDRNVGKRRPPHYLEAKLLDVAAHHRLVSKTRDSLASLSRVLTFLYTVPTIQEHRDARELCRTISRDIQSLSEHASFISGNITFLLDASLGLISVEQNAIIKIFSIASVVFLPPTLVASLYGMNFVHMPELQWTFGYPLALLAMVVSAIIPFYFFRWKGWL